MPAKVSVLDRFEPNVYTRFIPIIERRQTAVVAKTFSKTPGGPIWAVHGSSEAFGVAYLKAPPTRVSWGAGGGPEIWPFGPHYPGTLRLWSADGFHCGRRVDPRPQRFLAL